MIALTCTLEPYRIPWPPQLVHHYRSIGVERFLLTLQLEPSSAREARDRDYERFLATLTLLGIAEGYRWDCEWNAPAAIKNEWMIVGKTLWVQTSRAIRCDFDDLLS